MSCLSKQGALFTLENIHLAIVMCKKNCARKGCRKANIFYGTVTLWMASCDEPIVVLLLHL